MVPLASNINPAVRPLSSSFANEGGFGLSSVAKDVPTQNITSRAVNPPVQSFDMGNNFHKKPLQRIYNPLSAPSAVSSENFFAARALMSQVFVHNIAMTKQARISNLYKDAPEFRSQLNILV
jgi:hypothetical protein